MDRREEVQDARLPETTGLPPAPMPGRIVGWVVLGNLLVAALLVLATLNNLHDSRQEELARLRESADNLAHGLAIELAAEIRLVDNALATVAARQLEGRDEAHRTRLQHEAMREQGQLLPFATALRAADADGRVAVGLAPGERPFAIEDRDYFRQAREGRGSVISEPVFSRAFQGWCIIIARPLFTHLGEFRGIVYAVLASQHFQQLFARLSIGNDSAVSLRSDGLRLVARHAASAPASTQGLGAVDVSPMLRQKLAADRERGAYVIEAPLDGVERMIAYRRVAGYPLTVFTGLATSTYLAHWRADQRRQWLFTGAVILMVVSGFGYMLLQQRRQYAISVYATRIAHEQAVVLDNELVGMLRVKDRKVVWANRAIHRILGHPEVVGESTRQIYPDDASFEMVGRLGYEALQREGRFRTQLKMRRADGSDIWVDLSGASLGDAESVWMVLDIDQLKNSEERAQYMALHDPLTGLANRRLFEELLRQAVALARRQKDSLAVCYMDLDGFKPINDRHGHEAGDEVLREVAHRLQHELRSNDSVARLGGDEFAWLMAGVQDAPTAVASLERCLQAIRQPILLAGGSTVSVGASIGIVLARRHELLVDDLLAEADDMMYQAKRAGRGRIELRELG
ncbi:diguanylate cyclase [Pelomonas sp. KK5]|uniref:sensor domain-containing diguanylate cyclase n=1 Tax=Pelomonas sp. KK5 TaxID=1855730 RepID=UPI0013020500|nr:diguanylate cyclase [Pelomonas sp. KK5]